MSSAKPTGSAAARSSSATPPNSAAFRRFGFILILLAGLIPAFGARAATAEPIALSEAEQGQLGHIENYLDGIKTLKSRFVQISSTGDFAEGTLYIARPGRLRIEYDPPNPNLLVADGLWLVHYDKELHQSSHVLLDSTPASILVDERVRFQDSETLTLTGFNDEAGIVRVSVVRTEDPGEGEVTLVFEKSPLQLKKWTVVDAQGTVTTVSLQEPRYGMKLDGDLFHLEVENKPLLQ